MHAKAGNYVSDKTMRRAIRDKRRIADLLDSLVAINQTTGEMLPMNELAEQSLSIRSRKESGRRERPKAGRGKESRWRTVRNRKTAGSTGDVNQVTLANRPSLTRWVFSCLVLGDCRNRLTSALTS